MRILLGSETYRPELNGASYFTQRLAAALLERGHAVRVLCPSRTARSEPRREGPANVDGIASLPVPLYSAYRCAPAAPFTRAVERAVRGFAPDVIHIQNHFFIGRALVRVARRHGIPAVATNHFVPDHVLVQLPRLPGRWWQEPLRRCLWHAVHRVYREAQIVTTPTPLAAELLERSGLDRPVVPVSCGIDLLRFRPGDSHSSRERYGLNGQPTLLHVGRLDEDKNLTDIVRAFAAARQRVDAHLLVVGEGKERRHLEDLCRRLGVAGAVTFTGFIPDEELPTAYVAADAFCMAGTAELQSIATMEAMASGMPIVAARALALPHLVHDGVNGYTFTPGDVDGMAAHLVAVLGDPERSRRMGEHSMRIIAEHDIARTIDAFEALYERLVPSAGDGP